MAAQIQSMPIGQLLEGDCFCIGQREFMVYAIVRETGERCARKLADNTYWIFYDSTRVVQRVPVRVFQH